MHSKTGGRADLQLLMRVGASVLLGGGPGLAKTARIKAAAKAEGLPLFLGIGGRTADLMDRLDAAGAIVPDLATGTSKLLPLGDLQRIREHKGPGVWFIDEIGRAQMDVQGALCSLIDELRLSNPELRIWAATNRPGDKAGVLALSEQLRSRFGLAFAIPTPTAVDSVEGAVMLGTWGEELAALVEYGMADGQWPPEMIAWHRSTEGRTAYQWKPSADPTVRMADYRSWQTAANLWNQGVQTFPYHAAVLGKSVAGEFLAFARLANDLPSPDAVFMDPANALVPSEPASCYLIASMLVARAEAKHGRACVVYLERLPRVYGALLARDLLHKLGNGLAGCAEWVRYWNANQELFT